MGILSRAEPTGWFLGCTTIVFERHVIMKISNKLTNKTLFFYLVVVTSLQIYNNNIIVFSVVTKFPKERGIN